MPQPYILTITTDDVVNQYTYDNAIEAVHAFEKSRDYGDAKKYRSISLTEYHTNRVHTKHFPAPHSISTARESEAIRG